MRRFVYIATDTSFLKVGKVFVKNVNLKFKGNKMLMKGEIKQDEKNSSN
jgi:hypothetical protein